MDTARMKRLVPLVALLALTGCGGGGDSTAPSSTASTTRPPTSAAPTTEAPPPTFNVIGRVEVAGGVSQNGLTGEPCVTTGGFTDIHDGTQVVVSDAAGTTVALGDLSRGSLKGGGTPERSCVFVFNVRDVPSGQSFYSVEVADRGALTYTEDQLRVNLSLTLGF